jgi:GH18 family chitinase
MPPTKLAHLVFQTNRLPAMRDWYCTVLDGRVIYENPNLSFVTYDDPHSLGVKSRYIREHGLAGAMFWEYSSDPTGALLGALYDGLRGAGATP